MAASGLVHSVSRLQRRGLPSTPRQLPQVPLPEADSHRACAVSNLPTHSRGDPQLFGAGPVRWEYRGRTFPERSGGRAESCKGRCAVARPRRDRALPQAPGTNVHHRYRSGQSIPAGVRHEAAAGSCLGAVRGGERRAPLGGAEPIRLGPGDQRDLLLPLFDPAFHCSFAPKGSFT